MKTRFLFLLLLVALTFTANSQSTTPGSTRIFFLRSKSLFSYKMPITIYIKDRSPMEVNNGTFASIRSNDKSILVKTKQYDEYHTINIEQGKDNYIEVSDRYKPTLLSYEEGKHLLELIAHDEDVRKIHYPKEAFKKINTFIPVPQANPNKAIVYLYRENQTIGSETPVLLSIEDSLYILTNNASMAFSTDKDSITIKSNNNQEKYSNDILHLQLEKNKIYYIDVNISLGITLFEMQEKYALQEIKKMEADQKKKP